jgi:hypothetical protein
VRLVHYVYCAASAFVGFAAVIFCAICPFLKVVALASIQDWQRQVRDDRPWKDAIFEQCYLVVREVKGEPRAVLEELRRKAKKDLSEVFEEMWQTVQGKRSEAVETRNRSHADGRGLRESRRKREARSGQKSDAGVSRRLGGPPFSRGARGASAGNSSPPRPTGPVFWLVCGAGSLSPLSGRFASEPSSEAAGFIACQTARLSGIPSL